MIATSHVIIGGTLGVLAAQTTNNPAAGAAVALATGAVSHLICDLIPHLDLPPSAKFIGDDVVWDKGLYRFAIIDSLVAFFITLITWWMQFDLYFLAPYAWGALGGYLPDFVDNFPLWKDRVRQFYPLKQFHKLHLAIHNVWRHRFPMPKYWMLGTITQVITVGISFWALL